MTAARLAARATALLGPVPGPVAIACPEAPRLARALAARLAAAPHDGPAGAAVVAFLGASAVPAERQPLLRALGDRLPPGAPLVLVDHSQPRAWWRRAIGHAALVVRGHAAARGRYPAARELAALGFVVEALRLAAGERVQIVRARRR